MKHFIIASLLAFGLVTGPAMAGSISTEDMDLRGLSETQKASLVQQIEKFKADSAATESIVTAEKVSEWTMLGKEVASAFIALAGELGKTVDELLTTTIGKVALALIVYKVAGSDIIGVIGGLLWFVIFVPSWLYFLRKYMIVGTVTKEYHDNGKLKSKVVERMSESLTNDQRVCRFWAFIGLLFAGIVLEMILVFA